MHCLLADVNGQIVKHSRNVTNNNRTPKKITLISIDPYWYVSFNGRCHSYTEDSDSLTVKNARNKIREQSSNSDLGSLHFHRTNDLKKGMDW